MDGRIVELRRQLERARQHVVRCRAELVRFDASTDPGDVMLDRARDRLVGDLRKAELDAAWAEVSLADATSPMEVSQQEKA